MESRAGPCTLQQQQVFRAIRATLLVAGVAAVHHQLDVVDRCLIEHHTSFATRLLKLATASTGGPWAPSGVQFCSRDSGPLLEACTMRLSDLQAARACGEAHTQARTQLHLPSVHGA